MCLKTQSCYLFFFPPHLLNFYYTQDMQSEKDKAAQTLAAAQTAIDEQKQAVAQLEAKLAESKESIANLQSSLAEAERSTR